MQMLPVGRLSKGGQAAQVERVMAVCKAPKNGVVADVEGWDQDGPMTGHTPEPLCRRFETLNVVSNITGKRKISWLIRQRKYQTCYREMKRLTSIVGGLIQNVKPVFISRIITRIGRGRARLSLVASG